MHCIILEKFTSLDLNELTLMNLIILYGDSNTGKTYNTNLILQHYENILKYTIVKTILIYKNCVQELAGKHNPLTKATALNANSSRTFTIYCLSCNPTEGIPRGATAPPRDIAIVDLAGAERLQHTDPELRLEMVFINKTLTTLKRCFYSMQCEQAHIPFNDSALTKVLKKYLQGEVLLIGTVLNTKTPSKCTTRQFVEDCTGIKLPPKPIPPPMINNSLNPPPMINNTHSNVEDSNAKAEDKKKQLLKLLYETNSKTMLCLELLLKQA